MAKVVDTFLFSEAYEKELLLCKLHLESPLVERFVLFESTHTFRGERKGLQAKRMVHDDPRFAPFRDRLVVREFDGWVHPGPPGYDTYYENEERSRAWAVQCVLAEYPDDTWILVSDVDEAVDCTDPHRLGKFADALDSRFGTGTTVYFGHYRYWYDWDNRCYWQGIYTPAVLAGDLREGKATSRCRSRHGPRDAYVPAGTDPLFFEYTFCFPPAAMWRKLNSFIHDGYTVADLEKALATNHWVKAPARGERPGEQAVDWLETVALTELNSPRYVRDNLARLKTNVIPADYREHRRRLYGV